MLASSPILTCYVELEALAKRMLGAAQAGRMDDVYALQESYLARVEHLKTLDHDTPASVDERDRRRDHLERILACDAAIRDLLMPEWNRLSDLLRNSRRQRDLHQAYQPA